MSVRFEEFELHDETPRVIVRDMLTTSRATDLFLGDLIRRGYSQRTVDTYQRLLDKLSASLPVDTDVGQVTTDDCRRFFDRWNRKAPGTRAHVFAVANSFFTWLYKTERIRRNPLDRLDPPRRVNELDLDVVTVTAAEVRTMLAEAKPWTEKLAVAVVAYTGARRRAVANLRLRDYNRETGQLRFTEKGNKTVWKPVPGELVSLLEGAIAAGYITDPADFLVPPRGGLWNPRDGRDDRVIWRSVTDVAKRCGIQAHVHALRAAFAVFYLESGLGGIESLQHSMGHENIRTTQTYLRKLNKGAAMERVRALSWADNTDGLDFPQTAAKYLEAVSGMGAGGFEPPKPVPRLNHAGLHPTAGPVGDAK